MEISGKTQRYHLHVQQSMIDRDRPTVRKATAGRAAGNEDDVDLSGRGNMVRQALENLKTLPDIRAGRVAAIRQQIETGAYRIDGARVVTALMSESKENNEILKAIDGSTIPAMEGI